MLQVKLNNYWQSLQDREQKLLKTVFILLPIFILILYFMGLSDSISRNQQQLDIVKNNFNYVYQKANEFLVFSQVQEEIEVFESLPEFLVHQSSEFNLLAFGLAIFLFSVLSFDILLFNVFFLLNTSLLG